MWVGSRRVGKVERRAARRRTPLRARGQVKAMGRERHSLNRRHTAVQAVDAVRHGLGQVEGRRYGVREVAARTATKKFFLSVQCH
jgi:hypothetical protein